MLRSPIAPRRSSRKPSADAVGSSRDGVPAVASRDNVFVSAAVHVSGGSAFSRLGLDPEGEKDASNSGAGENSSSLQNEAITKVHKIGQRSTSSMQMLPNHGDLALVHPVTLEVTHHFDWVAPVSQSVANQ